MPRKLRQPGVSKNLRRLNKFDSDGICSGKNPTRKLHPSRFAKPGEKTLDRIVVINALVRDGASLREASMITGINKTTLRNRYYGLADYSPVIEEEGYFRMHWGAYCDLDHEIDYGKVSIPDVLLKRPKKLARKPLKKGPTLRELLYNRK